MTDRPEMTRAGSSPQEAARARLRDVYRRAEDAVEAVRERGGSDVDRNRARREAYRTDGGRHGS